LTDQGDFGLVVPGTSGRGYQNCFLLKTQWLSRKNEEPVEFWLLIQEAFVTLLSVKDSNVVDRRSRSSLLSYLLHRAHSTAEHRCCCREGAAGSIGLV